MEVMKNTPARILLVDDDDLNLDVLVEYLKDENYELVVAQDGAEALERLREHDNDFQAMVLDRMMPGIDGLEVVARLKADEQLRWLPVVMQTSAASPREICEGMEAGVFFYLTKPFEQQVLLRIVGAAVQEGVKYKSISRTLVNQSRVVDFLKEGRFHIRTMEEAYDLAMMLGRACPNSEKVVFGLNELLINGVEHGNLGIGFEEKTHLQENGTWEKEVHKRLNLAENLHKVVEVVFERLRDCIRITISDQGSGFEWRAYEYIQADRLLESHGRGIAMAKALSFSRLEYRGRGNEVVCIIKVESSN